MATIKINQHVHAVGGAYAYTRSYTNIKLSTGKQQLNISNKSSKQTRNPVKQGNKGNKK
jgi:hypothetical protein